MIISKYKGVFVVKKIILSLISLVLFLLPVSQVAANSVAVADENEKAKDLGEVLEFLSEEATIKNENGQPIKIDIDKVKDKYGSFPQLDQLKELNKKLEANTQKQSKLQSSVTLSSGQDELDICIGEKIENGYGDLITGAVLTDIVDYFQQGDYLSAGQKLAKAGLRGTPIAIGVTVYSYFFTCLVSIS